VITVYFNCDDYITKLKKKHLGAVYTNGCKWRSYFFPLFSVLHKYKEMDFTQVFHVNLTHFVLAKHKFYYQLVAKYLYTLNKAPTCFGQDVWSENVGALCYVAIYIATSWW